MVFFIGPIVSLPAATIAISLATPEIGLPFERIKATPAAIDIIPSVAINGGSLPLVTKKPLTVPHRTPASRASSNESGMPSPAARLMPSTILLSDKTEAH